MLDTLAGLADQARAPSIRNGISRFPMLLGAISLALAGAGAWRIHTASTAHAVEEFRQNQLHSTDVLAATLEAELGGAAATLRTLSAGVAGRAPRETARILNSAISCGEAPCFTAVTAFDLARRPIATAGRRIGLEDSAVASAIDWARDPASTGRVRTVISSSADPGIVFLVPVREATDATAGLAAGRLTGIVAGEQQFDQIFAHQQAGQSVGPGSTTLVLDRNGTVIFRSDHPEMRLRNVFNRTDACYSCHQSLAHVERMAAMTRGFLNYDVLGVARLAAVAPFTFEGQTWVVSIAAPADRAVVLLSSEVRQLGIVLLGLVLVLGLVGHVMWLDGRRRLETHAAAVHEAHLEKTNQELTALNARLESAAVEWRTTVDTIDAAVMVLDPDGNIERMNRAAADTLPGPPFSWCGGPSERLKEHPPWDAALKLARQAIDQDGTSSSRVEYPATGRTWDLWCRRPPRSDLRRSGVVVARDVTALVQLQESVARSETMAALGLVVVGVAHEVRNPLFTISSLVDAWSVQREGDPAPLIEALRREVFRLKTLMTDLLEYGKVRKTVLLPYALDPVLAEAVAACAAEATARGVTVDAPNRSEAMVEMDPRRLVRVFINVVQNAIQHAPEGTAVEIVVEKPAASAAPRLAVTVRDHGRGIAAEDLPKIFAPFFTRRAGGFGLGLAISERIVTEHGGKITADNDPSGGARVRIVLPLSRPEVAARTAAGGSHRC